MKQSPDTLENIFFTSVHTVGRYVGTAFSFFSESKVYRLFAEKIGINWVFDRITSVDISKVTRHVNDIKGKYPNSSPEKLSQLLIKNKLLYVGSTGFISGIAPANIPGFVFDIVASTAAQVELIYEIAIAYGMDLKDPIRKGEVMTLMALASGSNVLAEKSFKVVSDFATKQIIAQLYNKTLLNVSGLLGQALIRKFLYKLIPLCGGIIGAGINIVMLKTIGTITINYYAKVCQEGYVYDGELAEDLKVMNL